MSKYVCKAFVWEYYILIWIKSLPTIHLNSFSSLHFLLLYLFLSFLFLLLVLFPLHLLLSLCLWNQLLGYKKVSLISFFLFFGVLFVFFSTSCGIFEKKNFWYASLNTISNCCIYSEQYVQSQSKSAMVAIY